MSCLRPATPGFVVTLTATILLAVVSFCVPYVKSVFFLRASISQGGVNGSIIFGTLGYCLELSNGTVCSKPTVGYELNINGLVGNNLPIQIPQVAVKWLTSALVLHIAALIVAAASTVFGLLAHVREMSMTCCSTFTSGLAAAIALLAFIFDLILFFIAKARIKSVGSAQIGSAIWLTFAAWVLLFFSGCFYSCGKNCISNRPSKSYDSNRNGISEGHAVRTPSQRHLDAVKAEADRKLFQNKTETGLPAFPQLPENEPLTATIEGDQVHLGYARGKPGTCAAEAYLPSADPVESSRPSASTPPIQLTSNHPWPPTPPEQHAYPPLASHYGYPDFAHPSHDPYGSGSNLYSAPFIHPSTSPSPSQPPSQPHGYPNPYPIDPSTRQPAPLNQLSKPYHILNDSNHYTPNPYPIDPSTRQPAPLNQLSNPYHILTDSNHHTPNPYAPYPPSPPQSQYSIDQLPYLNDSSTPPLSSHQPPPTYHSFQQYSSNND